MGVANTDIEAAAEDDDCRLVRVLALGVNTKYGWFCH